MMHALLVGVFATLILQVAAAAAFEAAYSCCLDPASAPPLWYAAVSSPTGALISLLPGFIAGWMAQRKAILAGFLTGLIGSAVYSAIFLTQWQPVIESGPVTIVEMILRLIFLGIASGFGSAAAAGTAQLLRSNKRVQATRETRAPDA